MALQITNPASMSSSDPQLLNNTAPSSTVTQIITLPLPRSSEISTGRGKESRQLRRCLRRLAQRPGYLGCVWGVDFLTLTKAYSFIRWSKFQDAASFSHAEALALFDHIGNVSTEGIEGAIYSLDGPLMTEIPTNLMIFSPSTNSQSATGNTIGSTSMKRKENDKASESKVDADTKAVLADSSSPGPPAATDAGNLSKSGTSATEQKPKSKTRRPRAASSRSLVVVNAHPSDLTTPVEHGDADNDNKLPNPKSNYASITANLSPKEREVQRSVLSPVLTTGTTTNSDENAWSLPAVTLPSTVSPPTPKDKAQSPSIFTPPNPTQIQEISTSPSNPPIQTHGTSAHDHPITAEDTNPALLCTLHGHRMTFSNTNTNTHTTALTTAPGNDGQDRPVEKIVIMHWNDIDAMQGYRSRGAASVPDTSAAKKSNAGAEIKMEGDPRSAESESAVNQTVRNEVHMTKEAVFVNLQRGDGRSGWRGCVVM